jgi:hypothetical protein
MRARESRRSVLAKDDPFVEADLPLIGVHRAIVEFSRAAILAGTRNPTLVRRVRAQGRAALAALERGLADCGAQQR